MSDAKVVADLARAAETYARLQQLGEEAVSHARAICVDALALMGEMLKVSEKNTGAKGIGTSAVPKENRTPTLAQQGIPKKQSSTAQALAPVRTSAPVRGSLPLPLPLRGLRRLGGRVLGWADEDEAESDGRLTPFWPLARPSGR